MARRKEKSINDIRNQFANISKSGDTRRAELARKIATKYINNIQKSDYYKENSSRVQDMLDGSNKTTGSTSRELAKSAGKLQREMNDKKFSYSTRNGSNG